jgi:hypothetical protein
MPALPSEQVRTTITNNSAVAAAQPRSQRGEEVSGKSSALMLLS